MSARPRRAPSRDARDEEVGSEESAVAASLPEHPWPPHARREPTMTIGAVLNQLQAEFPAVRISKLRFLEDQGLVAPHRSGSGYRMYSQADVERLRFALAAQRDSFLPLRVIKQKLDALDAGLTPELPLRGAARSTGLVTGSHRERVTAEDLVDATGASLVEIESMCEAGLISRDEQATFPARAVDVVRAVHELAAYGLTPRHLRTVRQAAERHADTADQAVAPWRTGRSAADHERAAARAQEIGELYGQLYTHLMRSLMEENHR